MRAIELVLAQPTISSQLINSLNASMHVRALLTDLFLLNDTVTTLKALRRAEGRIYGAGGAAELLGLKPTTLTSRLRALKIDIPSR